MISIALDDLGLEPGLLGDDYVPDEEFLECLPSRRTSMSRHEHLTLRLDTMNEMQSSLRSVGVSENAIKKILDMLET